MQLLDPKIALPEADSRLLLHNISWDQYEALLAVFGDDHPGLRMNYLNGNLEVWMPGREHERLKTLFGRLIEAFAEEFDLELNGYGSTTFRKQAAARGLEPDECYCLGELKEVPDIAIEIVITTGLLDRLTIYRGLGVREVWVYRKQTLVFYHLETADQPYQISDHSQILPTLDPDLLSSFFDQANQTQAVKAYRLALRGKISPNQSTDPQPNES